MGRKNVCKMEDAVALLNQEYMKSFLISKENRTADLQSIVDYLKEYCLIQGVIFVHGRGKRKSVHQRYLELFQRFLDRRCMICTTHDLVPVTVIPRQMWMPLLCT